MTIDERLDRLTERHEALTQTVELLAGMQRTNEEHINKLIEATGRLVRVLEDHEHRIDGLEH